MRLLPMLAHSEPSIVMATIRPTGKSLRFIRSCCQSLSRKIFNFRFSEKCGCLRASRPDKRALRPIVTKRGAGCDGREWCARRSVSLRTAKSCGPDLPTLGSSLRSLQATVAKKPGTPGRTRISRKTTRAGNAGCFGVPVVTCLRAFFTCTQGCGCVRCTGIPCALLLPRDQIDASLGRASCRENAESHLPCCHAPARPGRPVKPGDDMEFAV
jgi:hypothetical protein